ncbi:hypothetical protein [Acaryochloris sp. IP29b_bin.137]|uniref:hypothetical protein n=1 Tax=Acaryochloris sp. IP29b_bin.137 TaxID=2969217 RepID=UPI00262BDBC9|nr:hypothetical protein [Acaryochloris sp. IP29b_bin.137]
MLFTIVDSFSPDDGDAWTSYCQWRGVAFTRFDSIDGLLRPRLFEDPEGEDWHHIVNEDFKLHLITDYDYAVHKHSEMGQGDLVGVKFSKHDPCDPRFLGFDLIDGYCDISLLTNWGNDVDLINCSLSSNALVLSYQKVEAIQQELLLTSRADPHVAGCQIVSIYRPNENEQLTRNPYII